MDLDAGIHPKSPQRFAEHGCIDIASRSYGNDGVTLQLVFAKQRSRQGDSPTRLKNKLQSQKRQCHRVQCFVIADDHARTTMAGKNWKGDFAGAWRQN